MIIKQITDKTQLFSFFKKNFCVYSYHIGDLDDFFFKDCKYLALINEDTCQIQDISLLFEGLEMPTLLALGETEKYGSFLEKGLDTFPDKFYCHYLPIHEETFLKSFSMIDLGLHQKMNIVEKPESSEHINEHIIQLTDLDLSSLEVLYTESYPDTYFNKRMLDTGLYYGWKEKGRILSVVGVHTYSKDYNMAVLGNITTHPAYRGNGYAYALLKTLISVLTKSVTNISLNVKKDNISAIKLYEYLGFRHCVYYKEALFERL